MAKELLKSPAVVALLLVCIHFCTMMRPTTSVEAIVQGTEPIRGNSSLPPQVPKASEEPRRLQLSFEPHSTGLSSTTPHPNRTTAVDKHFLQGTQNATNGTDRQISKSGRKRLAPSGLGMLHNHLFSYVNGHNNNNNGLQGYLGNKNFGGGPVVAYGLNLNPNNVGILVPAAAFYQQRHPTVPNPNAVSVYQHQPSQFGHGAKSQKYHAMAPGMPPAARPTTKPRIHHSQNTALYPTNPAKNAQIFLIPLYDNAAMQRVRNKGRKWPTPTPRPTLLASERTSTRESTSTKKVDLQTTMKLPSKAPAWSPVKLLPPKKVLESQTLALRCDNRASSSSLTSKKVHPTTRKPSSDAKWPLATQLPAAASSTSKPKIVTKTKKIPLVPVHSTKKKPGLYQLFYTITYTPSSERPKVLPGVTQTAKAPAKGGNASKLKGTQKPAQTKPHDARPSKTPKPKSTTSPKRPPVPMTSTKEKPASTRQMPSYTTIGEGRKILWTPQTTKKLPNTAGKAANKGNGAPNEKSKPGPGQSNKLVPEYWKAYTKKTAASAVKNKLDTFRLRAPPRIPGVRMATLVFRKGTAGYNGFRIPAIIRTKAGTLIAFSEGRRASVRADAGDIDIVARRSTDHGNTWSQLVVVASGGGDAASNPAPIVDARSGAVTLVYCRSPRDAHEHLIRRGEKPPRSVWIVRSTDDGRTWSEATQISGTVRHKSWTWYATGPGHGVQLKSGRLVIPCNHAQRADPRGRAGIQDRSHVIYSDDGGRSWRLGGHTVNGTNEATLVENPNGSLYMSSRQANLTAVRYGSWSYDGGQTFVNGAPEPELPEPVYGCQAALLRAFNKGGDSVVLFSNPASRYNRRNMLLRISVDNCLTWFKQKLVHSGPAAYSDMVQAANGFIIVLFEVPYGDIAIDRFVLG